MGLPCGHREKLTQDSDSTAEGSASCPSAASIIPYLQPGSKHWVPAFLISAIKPFSETTASAAGLWP